MLVIEGPLGSHEANRDAEKIVQAAEAFRICEQWQDSAQAYNSGKPFFDNEVNIKDNQNI